MIGGVWRFVGRVLGTTWSNRRVPGGGQRFYLYINTGDGKLKGRIYNTSDSTTEITSPASVADGKWHHVAVAYNSSADTNDPAIYVDGKQVNIPAPPWQC